MIRPLSNWQNQNLDKKNNKSFNQKYSFGVKL